MIDTYQGRDFHLDREQVIVHWLFRHRDMVDFSEFIGLIETHCSFNKLIYTCTRLYKYIAILYNKSELNKYIIYNKIN